MTLRKEYEDAARDEKLSVADVIRWVRALNYERQWRQSGYTVVSARAELGAAQRRRDECLLRLRAAERALTEAGEVVP